MATNTRKPVAMVTGGGSGIGRATAVRFAELGYSCVVADIDEQSAKETLGMLQTPGIAVQVDVTMATSVEAMVTAAVQRFGRIDCAFNSAGIMVSYAKIADQQEEEFDRVMGINAKGVWLCLKYEIAQMLQQEPVVSNPARWADKPDVCRFRGVRGSIVNASSIAGLGGYHYNSPYCASKWAVLGITQTAAVEYAKDGIRVNAVCPAATDTPMLNRFKEKCPPALRSAAGAKKYPFGRIAAPEEIAEAVCWLCSDACPFTTGEHLKIAGGM
ncbi:2,5-dichloro-2,5-cyclohexadiene-1,4-diol dehydrogenase-like [Branchiostoma floridae]|uniref:2,5-dichloro-2,5-cyclohexadiene-1,4-diol dehydrogenase-like n=1 Tax=Branchiostoma floridae TaxID=7739 RepID=A0A9J7N163_BRAFL|nr:2,5-dichloro-2,5-cyclohexadiene-1,4-diol dehydrogenase-like [Branchiostoma floridae]